jgi:exosortase/archaeosortase family protein
MIKTSIGSIDVSWDSTGWKSLYAMTALILATPLNRSYKLKFLAIALPVIFIVNILRIVTTTMISTAYGMQYFDFVHLFLWREGLISAVVALWAIWLWRERHNIIKDEGIFRWVLGKGF